MWRICGECGDYYAHKRLRWCETCQDNTESRQMKMEALAAKRIGYTRGSTIIEATEDN